MSDMDYLTGPMPTAIPTIEPSTWLPTPELPVQPLSDVDASEIARKKVNKGLRWFGGVVVLIIIGAALGNAGNNSTSTNHYSPLSSSSGISTPTTISTSFAGFSNRAECMGAAWTTVADCNTHFPTETGSGAYSTSSIERTFVETSCTEMLNVESGGVSLRTMLRVGTLTRSQAAAAFASGYVPNTGGASTLTTSEVISACVSGMNG